MSIRFPMALALTLVLMIPTAVASSSCPLSEVLHLEIVSREVDGREQTFEPEEWVGRLKAIFCGAIEFHVKVTTLDVKDGNSEESKEAFIRLGSKTFPEQCCKVHQCL